MKRIIPLLTIFVTLCGCTQTVELPYVSVSTDVYAFEDIVWDHGDTRVRTPTDKQALQFVTDETGVQLVRGELSYYTGTLYSLSNYRELLLLSGYVEHSLTRTCDVLDTILAKDGDRVRLIYQPSGLIRILFENQEGVAHILLEGIS